MSRRKNAFRMRFRIRCLLFQILCLVDSCLNAARFGEERKLKGFGRNTALVTPWSNSGKDDVWAGCCWVLCCSVSDLTLSKIARLALIMSQTFFHPFCSTPSLLLLCYTLLVMTTVRLVE